MSATRRLGDFQHPRERTITGPGSIYYNARPAGAGIVASGAEPDRT
jgi:hypothetical protein